VVSAANSDGLIEFSRLCRRRLRPQTPVAFRGERVGAPIPSLKSCRKPWKRRSYPLLKCLRTSYGRHCEPVSCHKCTRLQDFAYTISKIVPRVILSGSRQKCPPVLLDPDTNFRSARQRSHRSCFTKRPLANTPTIPHLVAHSIFNTNL